MDIYSIINLNFVHFPVELIICEVIFLLKKPRREHFLTKLLLSMILYFSLACGWMTLIDSLQTESLVPLVFLYLGYALLTAVPIGLCFDIQGLELLFSIAGGYATQHMCFALLRIYLIEMGTYEIMAGASVSDIRLKEMLEIEGTTNEYPYHPAQLPYYYTGLVRNISDSEFETLLGHPIPSGKWAGELGLNDAICQMYYAKSGLARFVYNRLTAMKKKSEDAGKPDLNILFIYNMPFRALAKMTGGMISMEMAEGILEVVNGRFFKGIGKVITGFFRNRKANKDYEKLLDRM